MDTNQIVVVVLITVACVLAAELLALLAAGGGSLARLGHAWQALRQAPAAAPEPAKPPKRSAEPLRLLAMMQREGRVLDFFLEDISGATDNQIGAGVRELHQKTQKLLQEHLVLGPVLPQSEGETVEVPAGFDPSAIRLTGNVSGKPPFRGTLKHAGWRVREYKIPAPPEGQDEFILAPAEVDLP